MALVKKGELGLWGLSGGKYVGKTLVEVAQRDPSYLNWVWTSPKVNVYLSDEAAAAVEDVMKKFGIPFDKMPSETVAS